MKAEDLATALISNDYDKKCQLNCGKEEWGDWKDGGGDHKHKDGCPFALAYQALTPGAEETPPAPPTTSGTTGELWHIQEGFTLNLSGEFLALVYGDDEIVRFHIDEIDDVVSALKRAKGHIQAEEIKANEAQALARWGKERTPADVV